jgi:hypothetical protein
MQLYRQIMDMRRKYPNFQLTCNYGWMACWQGELVPIGKPYRVRIRVVRRRFFATFEVRSSRVPIVQLVDPVLDMTKPYADAEPLIHVYDHLDPDRVCLCLDDPECSQWTEKSGIADTLIPWIIDWLVSYELWQTTGKWLGGGRDHRASTTMRQPCQPRANESLTWNHDPLDLYVNDVYQGLGPQVANFASSALTVAVYEAFSQRYCSPSSKSTFCLQNDASTNISTSSPALPRAA